MIFAPPIPEIELKSTTNQVGHFRPFDAWGVTELQTREPSVRFAADALLGGAYYRFGEYHEIRDVNPTNSTVTTKTGETYINLHSTPADDEYTFELFDFPRKIVGQARIDISLNKIPRKALPIKFEESDFIVDGDW